MRALALLTTLCAAALAAAPGASLAQAPGALGGGLVAPGSGFANGPSPVILGGAPLAPGSGLSPSAAGTLQAPRPVIGVDPDLGRNALPAGVNAARTPRRARSRDGYSPSYPGVPDIIAPAD